MRPDIRFYPAVRVGPHNEKEDTMFGVGVDRSLWVQLELARLSEDRVEGMRRRHGGEMFCTGPFGRVYVDARALVLECGSPPEQEVMALKVRELVDVLRPLIPLHEPPRNN